MVIQYTHIGAHTHTYIYIYIYIYMNTHTCRANDEKASFSRLLAIFELLGECVCVCVCVCVCECVCALMNSSVNVCVCVLSLTHTHTHTHIHSHTLAHTGTPSEASYPGVSALPLFLHSWYEFFVFCCVVWSSGVQCSVVWFSIV
jgi:hypothetical protein